jgi:CheY-like chemotaxis protein
MYQKNLDSVTAFLPPALSVGGHLPSPRILIVEDEAVIAMDIRATLSSLGYGTPTIAFSGEDSLLKAEALRPDLVLMDIRIKGDMDGIVAAHEIYRRFRIPVVYVTAYSDRQTIERAWPFRCLGKPFEPEELNDVIRSIVSPRLM